jgi:hypothetical protein
MGKKKYAKPKLNAIKLDNDISLLLVSTGYQAPPPQQTGTETQDPCVGLDCFINPFKWIR